MGNRTEVPERRINATRTTTSEDGLTDYELSELETTHVRGHSLIVPALPEVYTFGETHEEALRNAHEAIELALRGRQDAGEEIPTSDNPPVERITVSISAA